MAGAALLTLPSALMRFHVFGTVHEAPPLETLLFGIAILGAAFLVSWAAEVAQLDISKGLAIAFLALIAVLPEYAVDLVFSWKAGVEDRTGVAMCQGTHCRGLAVANMTFVLGVLPCTTPSLTANNPSPQPSGSQLTLTATTNGCPNPAHGS